METMTSDKNLGDSNILQGSTIPRDLTVQSVMTDDVVTVTVDETVSSVAKKMTDSGVSCVVVTEGMRIKG